MTDRTAGAWEYRLVHVNLYVEGDPPLELHRVYYNEDGSLRLHMPLITVAGDDPATVLAQVQAMAEACGKPVIDANDFPEAEPVPRSARGLSFTLKTRHREKPPPERKTPELRVVGKNDKQDEEK
ncbi:MULTISPECIES: hypothetical protein [unclassified Variovorax]|uniref:hypothetical protein n=1 Tax=unclassified Variovorax TaxID=663243 RepID=UPI00076C6A13|nr:MULTISPECIES: hypothetical protein [unclassified Variovorax]KWT70835.1 hypothetical protein APY03_6591 [Variovorax sp. WDL1]PNG49201.1 hypothetical protein CHC06_06438 [Variovorax sp. B2]PNG49586.1 hypothetical protein CHC07_06495 [Variovorax sp. B4]VTV18749.1 hypothetical protein WDL1P2_00402 [Variovorax sp. WDL1]